MQFKRMSRWAWLGVLACLLVQQSLAATEAPIDCNGALSKALCSLPRR